MIGRELHKKLELKIAKYGYVRGSLKRLATQIGLLKILGVNNVKNCTVLCKKHEGF
jgi:hypothetical protein